MDEMNSAEFRKRYAKLTAVTRVTVNGHLIGEWTPMGLTAVIDHGRLKAVRQEPVPFNSRPFTPVPKK